MNDTIPISSFPRTTTRKMSDRHLILYLLSVLQGYVRPGLAHPDAQSSTPGLHSLTMFLTSLPEATSIHQHPLPNFPIQPTYISTYFPPASLLPPYVHSSDRPIHPPTSPAQPSQTRIPRETSLAPLRTAQVQYAYVQYVDDARLDCCKVQMYASRVCRW